VIVEVERSEITQGVTVEVERSEITQGVTVGFKEVYKVYKV